MALKSLNQLRSFRNRLIAARNAWLVWRRGLVIGEGVSISLSARFQGGPSGAVVIGDRTLVAFRTLFLTRDAITGEHKPIRIGSHCFIGGGSIIMPGVTIGDGSIVGAGSVVFEDVPAKVIAVGNPARVLKRDVEVGPMGRLKVADENTKLLYRW